MFLCTQRENEWYEHAHQVGAHSTTLIKSIIMYTITVGVTIVTTPYKRENKS